MTQTSTITPVTAERFYVTDDNGRAAEWYLNGPEEGQPAHHDNPASAAGAARRLGLDPAESIVRFLPPMPDHV